MCLLQSSGVAGFSSAQIAANLFCECLVVAELLEEWLVEEILDVFCVVKGGGSGCRLGCLLLVAWFSRVNACKKELGYTKIPSEPFTAYL